MVVNGKWLLVYLITPIVNRIVVIGVRWLIGQSYPWEPLAVIVIIDLLREVRLFYGIHYSYDSLIFVNTSRQLKLISIFAPIGFWLVYFSLINRMLSTNRFKRFRSIRYCFVSLNLLWYLVVVSKGNLVDVLHILLHT